MHTSWFKTMKHIWKKYKIICVLLVLMIVWSVFFTVDYHRVHQLEDPVFCFKQSEYSNYENFTGLFYIVVKDTHLDVTPASWQDDESPSQDEPAVVYRIYPWFWPH